MPLDIIATNHIAHITLHELKKIMKERFKLTITRTDKIQKKKDFDNWIMFNFFFFHVQPHSLKLTQTFIQCTNIHIFVVKLDMLKSFK